MPFVTAFQKIDGGTIKVVVATVQIVLSISWNLDMAWPGPMANFSLGLSFIELNFLSVDCIEGSNYHYNVLSSCMFPAVLGGAILASFFIQRTFQAAIFASQAKKDATFATHMGGFLL